MDAQTLYPLHTGERLKQLGQTAFAIQVKPVISGVLGDDDEFAHALGSQLPGLRHQIFHGNRLVPAADKRNRTVGTAAVAALGNFQVSVAAPLFLTAPYESGRRRSQITEQRIEVAGSEPGIHLRNQLRHLGGVTFGQAAEYHKLAGIAETFGLNSFQDCLYGFFLGVAYEAAGVVKQVIEGRFITDTKVICRQGCQQMLGIHAVLGTAQGNDLKPFQALFRVLRR